jgi:hypothetical protein
VMAWPMEIANASHDLAGVKNHGFFCAITRSDQQRQDCVRDRTGELLQNQIEECLTYQLGSGLRRDEKMSAIHTTLREAARVRKNTPKVKHVGNNWAAPVASRVRRPSQD